MYLIVFMSFKNMWSSELKSDTLSGVGLSAEGLVRCVAAGLFTRPAQDLRSCISHPVSLVIWLRRAHETVLLTKLHQQARQQQCNTLFPVQLASG
jgi:hypothetical protein